MPVSPQDQPSLRDDRGGGSENGDEFAYAAAVGLVFAQQIEHFLVLGRPPLPPLPHGKRILEGARALFQQSQIVQRIEDILLALKAARMFRNNFRRAQDFHPKRIGAQW